MSSSSRYEDLKIKEIRDNDALIADYNDDYIYTVSVDTCDCDEFINTKNPCIHILYYNQFVIPNKDSIKLNHRIARLKYLAIIATLLIALAFFIAHVKNTNIKPYTNDPDSLADLFLSDTGALECSDVSIMDYGADDGSYTIAYTCDKFSYWDNNEFMTRLFSQYIRYCKKAYQIDGVNKITLVTSTHLLDSYGNVYVGKVVKLSMPREKFNSYNWENLMLKPVVMKFGADGDVEFYNGFGHESYLKVIYRP